jgi:hypothetical protein
MAVASQDGNGLAPPILYNAIKSEQNSPDKYDALSVELIYASPIFDNSTVQPYTTALVSYNSSTLRLSKTAPAAPHSKWRIYPTAEEIYTALSPILDEYDPVTGLLVQTRGRADNIGRYEVGLGIGSTRKEGTLVWCGYVRQRESRERFTLTSGAEHLREDKRKESLGDVTREINRC